MVVNRALSPDEADGWFYVASLGDAEDVLALVWREFEYNGNAAKTRAELRHVEGTDYKVTVTVERAE